MYMATSGGGDAQIGEARLTFVDHIMAKRIFKRFLFPAVQAHDKAIILEECPICMQMVLLGVEFSGCGHHTHGGCLATWHQKTCPWCREPYSILRAD